MEKKGEGNRESRFGPCYFFSVGNVQGSLYIFFQRTYFSLNHYQGTP